MSNWSPLYLYETMSIITAAEAKVLDAIRSEKVTSVNVKLNSNKEIELIETTRVEPVKTKHEILDLIMGDGYQEINIKTEKGKLVHCRNVTKHKIKKNYATVKHGAIISMQDRPEPTAF